MAILNITIGSTGLVGVLPRVIYIETNNTVAEVLATGFLNSAKQNGFAFGEADMALVTTKTSPSALSTECMWAEVSISGQNISLVPAAGAGSVVIPTVANYISHFTNTTGTLSSAAANVINAGNIQAGLSGTAGILKSFPATAARGSLNIAGVANTGDTVVTISNAAHGQASVYSIPDGGQATAEFIISDSAGTQHITSGAFQVDAGVISSGISTGGTGGGFIAYPASASNGSLRLTPVGNAGNFAASISNVSTLGQATVYTIPDPGAATANFVLDAGPGNIIAKQQFVGINSILIASVATWTVTRLAQGDYALVKTAAADTSNVSFDITPQIQVAASKGFRLDSIDFIYSIATLDLNAHTVTLDRIAYANNVAVSVTSIGLTGALATATQAQPYLSNITVSAPAFDVTADSKYIIEMTVNAAATSDYNLYGLMLRFSETVA